MEVKITIEKEEAEKTKLIWNLFPPPTITVTFSGNKEMVDAFLKKLLEGIEGYVAY